MSTKANSHAEAETTGGRAATVVGTVVVLIGVFGFIGLIVFGMGGY